MVRDLKLAIRLVADGKGFKGEVSLAQRELKKLGVVADGAQKHVGQLSKGMATLSKHAQYLSFAALAVGAYQAKNLAKSIVHAGATLEQYQVRLRVALGDVQAGNKLLADMRTYAAQVPFEFEQIAGAATMLAAVAKGGADEVNRLIPIIGDLAAASGLTFQQTAEQMVRAMSAGIGAADLFRERGVTAMLGFQAGATASGEETMSKIIQEFERADSKWRGAAEKLADIWDGEISMMRDAWFNLAAEIADSGVLEALSDEIKSMTAYLKTPEMQEAVRNFGKTAAAAIEAIGATAGLVARNVDLIGVALASILVGRVVSRLGRLATAVSGVGIAARSAGIAVAFFGGPLGAIAAGATVAGFALKSFYDAVNSDQRALEELTTTVGNLTKNLDDLTDAEKHSARAALEHAQAQAIAGLAEVERSQALVQHRFERHGDKALRFFGADEEGVGNRVIEGLTEKAIALKQILNEARQGLVDLDTIDVSSAADGAGLSETDIFKQVENAKRLRNLQLNLREKAQADHAQWLAEIAAAEDAERQRRLELWREGLEAQQALLAGQHNWQQVAREGFEQYADSGKTAVEAVRDATAEGMQAMEDALTHFVATGKLEFGNLAQSILSDLARIAIRQSITGPLAAALGGLFGGKINDRGFLVDPGAGPVQLKHSGGIVGGETSIVRRMIDAGVFENAHRYHRGGLASDEVPAILQRGEMVIPRNLVQASQQPPQVEIHFENRGTPQREVGRTVQFDGQRTIVSVILDDMDRNGPIAQTMQRNFALNPAVS